MVTAYDLKAGKKILVYVAGPYRAIDNPHEPDTKDYLDYEFQSELNNITNAGNVGNNITTVYEFYPVVPHRLVPQQVAKGQTDKYHLDGTMEVLLRCDLLVLLPGWKKSKGSRAEHGAAILAEIPFIKLQDRKDIRWELLKYLEENYKEYFDENYTVGPDPDDDTRTLARSERDGYIPEPRTVRFGGGKSSEKDNEPDDGAL